VSNVFNLKPSEQGIFFPNTSGYQSPKTIALRKSALKGPTYDKKAEQTKQSPKSFVLDSVRRIFSAVQRVYSEPKPLISLTAAVNFLSIASIVSVKSSNFS